jgi:tetratricopeptide (TPR) repeat protein
MGVGFMIRNEILIGRQNLKEKIVDLYNENNDKNILLVKGPSGIGKSYAIQHLTNDYRELNQVTCKAYQQHIAEFTLIKDLLNKLMELILVLPSKDFNPLVYQMKHTLSSELEYIAFLSERARKIFVDIKPRTFINYEGQKYKVRKALSHFFKAVCNNIDHVFIHLDDIQWVDDNSLDLIKTLLKVKSLNASFILSYRDEFLGMSKEEKIYDLVTLSPLTIVEIEEVLSKSIDSNLSDLGYLTKHIYSTTLGIPFYIAKVMDELIEKQIIELDEKPQIHIDQLTKVNISENLNEIMLSRVSELTESEKLFLEYLSCLEGNVSKVYFDAIFPLKSDQMVTNLLDKSFIFVTDQRYCFTHDIIFEYIYQQIDPVERESIYTVIANNLCRYYEDDKDLWPLLVSAIVKIKNRNWCQKRGEQWFEILSEASNHTINYKTTRDILMVCKEIMVAYPNLYKNDILIKLAKCHYLLGEIQCAKSLYTFLENKADTKSALLNIEDQRMNMYTFVGHHDKAMETGKKMLKLLGLEYDIRGRDAIIKALGDQDNLNFLDTWHFSKPSQGEINREYILYKMIPSSKFVGPHHFDYCMLLLSSSVYERPEGKYKIFALTAYAFVLFNILNKYTLAKQCSDFILNHLDFDSEDEMIQETIAFYLTFVHHWSNDLEDTIEYLQKNNTICLEEGIITHFNYSLASLMFAYTSVGGNILTVAKNLNQRIELLDVLSVEERQFINTFVTMTLKRYIDVLNRCGAVALEERPVVIQEVVVIWFSILASYINGHIREAYKAIKQLQGYFSEVKGHIVYPDMMCFSTLIMLENHGNLSCQDQTLDRELIDANRLYLKNITDDYAKNHQGRYYLVEGMYQSVFAKSESPVYPI